MEKIRIKNKPYQPKRNRNKQNMDNNSTKEPTDD